MHISMASVIFQFVLVFITLFTLCLTISNEVDPLEPSLFEAAFQGKCGKASPCAQLCRELHDGTYECGCRAGYVLRVDGYSCQEINNISRSVSDNYVESEEDVLYQKDASFSAELDVALMPARETENTTYKPDDSTTQKTTTAHVNKYLPFDFFSNGFNIFHQTAKQNLQEEHEKVKTKTFKTDKSGKTNNKKIKGTPLYSRHHVQTNQVDHEQEIDNRLDDEDKVLLKPVVEKYNEDVNPQEYKLYKEIEGLKSLDGLTSKDIKMIVKAEFDGARNKKPSSEDVLTLITTTLGPSLEQKVPPMSTVGPGHTESVPRSGCPLGKMGPNCDKVAPPVSIPKFSGSGWLALPALRGAYKRVRLRLHFRPTSRDGVLLITGERSDMAGDYLAIVLHKGFIELIFDCGSGPGVVRSDAPVMMNQWNTLVLYRRRWDAWIQVNNGKHIQGRSKGLFSRMTFLEPVFIGGAGNMTGLGRLPTQQGYSGCIRSLEINGREYRFQTKPKGDALDGFAVGECGSLGCSKNCLHGGRCMKHCLCPLGYAGDYCETQLDLQVPRFNGSSFLRYRGLRDSALSWLELQITLKSSGRNGLIMYNSHRNDGIGDFFALYLKNGHVEFAFDLGTGQAVIRSPKPIELQEWYTVNVSRTGRLAVLTVNSHPVVSNQYEPEEDIFMDSQISQGLSPGAFTQLSLAQNLFLGGIPQFRIIQKRVQINDSFNGCIQKVVINDHEMSIVSSALGGVNIDGCPHACMPGLCGEGFCRPRLHYYTCVCSPGIRSEKCTIFLNETSDSHSDHSSYRPLLGQLETMMSHPSTDEQSNFFHNSIVPKKGPRSSNKHSKNSERATHHTTQDSMNVDDVINYTDKAQTEWVLSDKKNSKIDEQEERRSFISSSEGKKAARVDKTDWKRINKSIMQRNDWDIPKFNGHDSYIRNTDPLILQRLSSDSVDINIRFKSQMSEGLLLWLGKDGMAPGDTFMALAIEAGLLTFRYDVGSGEVIISANQTRVDDGLWHRARASRKGQSGILEIDGLGAVGKASPGNMRPLFTDSGLLIGGMEAIWPETVGRYRSGFEGCISKLILDRVLQIPLNFTPHQHKTLKNVTKCPT